MKKRVEALFIEVKMAESGKTCRRNLHNRIWTIDDDRKLEHIEGDEYWLLFEWSGDRARVRLLK
jgi:hypothetical protein